MKFKIPLAKPYFDSEEIRQIKEVLKSGYVTKGPKARELEIKMSKPLGVKYAVAVNSGTAALHLALLSLGIKKGDEVLVPDFTFPATAHVVLYCGAKPVFIDVDMKTYNIDPDLIEEKITKKTKAIIPVHLFGQSCEMKKIMKIAKEYEIKIIEDAACALGAKYYNKFVGTFGNISCFSFHARKNITTGEGGMVVTNDKNLAEKARSLSQFGIQIGKPRINSFVNLGYNYKMSDVNAAMGIAQLKKLNIMIKRRRFLAKYWDEALEKINFITPPYVEKNCYHVYQSYVCVVNTHANRDKLISTLSKKGIETQIGTYACHIQPVYDSNDKCPNSLKLFEKTIALPFYCSLKESEIDLITNLIKKIKV